MLVNRLSKGKKEKSVSDFVCLSRCFFFFFLTIIGKVREIDKKDKGKRKEGKKEREDLPPCPFNALAMFPGTSPK